MFLKTDFLEAGYLYLLAYLLPDLGLGFLFLPEPGLARYTTQSGNYHETNPRGSQQCQHTEHNINSLATLWAALQLFW